MEIEIEEYDVKFEFSKVWYEVSGSVIHHTEREDIGIGKYEYQGASECRKEIVYRSEDSKAEFSNLGISYRSTSEEIKEPSKYLLEAAKEALFSATQEKAEREACECDE